MGSDPTAEIMGEQPQLLAHSSMDATLNKLFVGGLAWETQREALCDHFLKFGEIVEAVVITDKLTGRSKGYGFVTFKEADAAKKACEDTSPVINGRKANCNIAYVGTRRGSTGKISPPATPVPLSSYTATAAGARPAAVPWYFPPGTSPSSQAVSPFQQHYLLPFYSSAYGYSPLVAPTNFTYGTSLVKPTHSGAGGAYIPGPYSYPAQGGGLVAPLTVGPVYHPMYQFHHHHLSQPLPHSMGKASFQVAQFLPTSPASSGGMRATHASKLPAAVPAGPAAARLASAEAF